MTLIVIIIWVIMYEIQRLSSAPKRGGSNFFFKKREKQKKKNVTATLKRKKRILCNLYQNCIEKGLWGSSPTEYFSEFGTK